MDDPFQVCGAPVIESNDPPPPYNPLNRPTMHYVKPILCLGGLAALLTTLILALPQDMPFPKWLLIVLSAVIYGLIFAKRTVIWLVHFYQSRASDKTRLRCVFEPSCSEYMILAVEKYGVFRGVYKGCDRLLRCHPPNGGRDDP